MDRNRAPAVCVALALFAAVTACSNDATGDLDADAPATDVDVASDADTRGDDLDTEESDAVDAPDDTGDLALDAVDADTDEADPLIIDRLAVTENPRNILSFFIEWRTSEPANTLLAYECRPGETGVLASGTLTTDHRVFLMGLLQETRCQITVASRTDDGRAAIAATELTAGSLDDASFPDLAVTVAAADRLQPGWTLFNLTNRFAGKVMKVVLVDELGRFRWYYQIPWSIAGADNDVRTVPEGVMIGAIEVMRPQIIGWDGSVIWEGDRPMHHDIRLWPDPDHVMFLDFVEGDCNEVNPTWGVTIQNRETLEVAWQWQLCRHFDPVTDIDDWEHANTVTPFPDGLSLLTSARNLHALYKVDVETGAIEWAMGYSARADDGFLGDFEMAEEDYFYRQHAPEILDNGNILLFDNGAVNWREESRAIEIAYDDQAMTAEVIWEYRHDPPLFSDIWGDADGLSNGNRLIAFGFRSVEQGSVVVEAAPEVDSTPIWTLELPPGWGLYRAERVVDIPRGTVIDNE